MGGEVVALGPGLRPVEQGLGLLAAHVGGQPLVQLGHLRRAGDVVRDPVVLLQEAVQAPHRRERPRRRALGEAAPLELAEEAAHAEAVHRRPGPGAGVVAVAELGERLEVAAVGFHGVRGLAAFLVEVGQELGDSRGAGMDRWLFNTKARRARRTTKPDPTPTRALWGGCGFVVLRALRAFVLNEHRHSKTHRSCSRNRPNSACARSTSSSFLRSFLTFPGSGSSSPKLAFIGWKCLGSASRR